jgi:hypothetical protein
MHFTNKMTFIPEEYAKLTDTQRTSLYDVGKEARDKAPSRSISVAAVKPAPAPAAAPATTLAPVQRTIQIIGLVPTAPAAASADNGQDIHHLLSNAAATTCFANQAPHAPAATTTGDIFVYEGVVYRLGNHNIQYIVNNNKPSSMLGVLVDGGANGGLGGSEIRVIETSFRREETDPGI